jgi:hypothetical protein
MRHQHDRQAFTPKSHPGNPKTAHAGLLMTRSGVAVVIVSQEANASRIGAALEAFNGNEKAR